MISALSLWLPVLLSALGVFIVSSVIHMVLTYHRSDFKGVPSEDGVMDALRSFNIPEGEYFMPYIDDPKQRETDEFRAKEQKGPVAFLTVISADYQLGKKLVSWFLYNNPSSVARFLASSAAALKRDNAAEKRGSLRIES
jgi:hypothetical protein